MTTDQLNTFRARLAHAVTEIDRKEDERDRRARRRCNPYRLGIMLGAVEECAAAIGAGADPAAAFASNFTPTRENHAAARALGLPLDVERGRWVRPTVERSPETIVPGTRCVMSFGVVTVRTVDVSGGGVTLHWVEPQPAVTVNRSNTVTTTGD